MCAITAPSGVIFQSRLQRLALKYNDSSCHSLCNLVKVSCRILQFAKVDCSALRVGDEKIGVHGRGHPDRWLAAADSGNSLQPTLKNDIFRQSLTHGTGRYHTRSWAEYD